MKRIIQKIEAQTSSLDENGQQINFVELFQIPNGSMFVSIQDGMYIDYIAEEAPETAYYVGEMNQDGTVTDIVGTAVDFPHSFAGWQNSVWAEPSEIPLEPIMEPVIPEEPVIPITPEEPI
jgi:hypothetical protein